MLELLFVNVYSSSLVANATGYVSFALLFDTANWSVSFAHDISLFDVKFLNFELKQIGLQGLSEFSIIDTLDLARQKFPGQKATLDMLCERFGISLDERHRHGHNALLDSQILVEVFLKLTKGTVGDAWQTQQLDFVGFTQRTTQLQARIFKLSAQEQQQHEQFLASNQIVE